MYAGVFIAALVVGIAALYWMILRNSAEKISAQYGILADKLGLALSQPEPKMRGFIRPEPSLYGTHLNRELSISVPGKGLQNTRQIETVLKLELRDSKFAAQLTGTGLLGGFRQRDSGGMIRWKSGKDSLDAAVDVRTNRVDQVSRILEGGNGEALVKILRAGKGSVYIGGGVMAYAELGLIANDIVRQRFEAVLELFLKQAEVIESGC